MKSPCMFDAARRDLEQKTTSTCSGIGRPCGENAASAIPSTEKEKVVLARSARTQRSVRSVRLGGNKAGVVGRYGVVRKMHSVQCHADSVKHATSPSRRDISRRVIHVASDPTSVRRSRTLRCPAPLRRVPQSVQFQIRIGPCPTRLRASRSPLLVCRCAFSCEARETPGRIQTQDSRSHIAMSYEPSIAWKASLRAHRRRYARPFMVLKPRWSGKPLNAASDLITTRWCSSDNRGFPRGWRLFATVATLHAVTRKPSF